MKLKILVLLLAMVFFLVGCASAMFGQKVPVGKLSRLSSYDTTFTFEGSGDIVTFRLENGKLVGKIVFGKLGYSGHEIEQLTLVAWFTDADGVILEKSSYSWKGREFDMGEGLEFVMEMPQGYYDFVYVGFSYSGTYLG